MPGVHAVAVSPRHTVTLDDDYLAMVRRAPQQDYVVRTLARRTAGAMTLMSGDLVIAGWSTREAHPLAHVYPLHFRKTYYPGRLHGDTRVEFARHSEATAILGIPPPIGCTESTFRSCLLPGQPFDQLSSFGSEPEESNLRHADALSLAAAAGLWLLAERIYANLSALHAAGLAHGDAELHNFVVCHAPLDVVPIDFEAATRSDGLDDAAWERRCARDLEPLLKTAVYLQCALGAQAGPLGEKARDRMDALFARSAPFRRAIDERAGLLSKA